MLAKEVFACYRPSSDFDYTPALRFAGVEIMRRLVGVEQLPLSTDLVWKEVLLQILWILILELGAFGN